jgi:Protein of unknown function (DUF2795)
MFIKDKRWLYNFVTINNMNQEKRDQIPQSSGPESQIGEVISQQNATEGLRKEVNVESYSDVSKIGQLLKDVGFPAPKSKILQKVRQSEDFQNKENILRALNNLEERSYNNVSDVTTSAGLVYK